MKIEVEFSDMERLRKQVREQNQQIESLQKELSELGEAELKKRAINLSYRLFQKYVKAIFGKLGFEEHSYEAVVSFDNLEYNLGKDWWNKQGDITVSVGATVTDQFRQAFLRIGVVPKEERSEPEELKL